MVTISCCCGGLVLFYALFQLCIGDGYFRTFFSTQSGNTYCVEIFTKSHADEQKM